MYFEFFVASHDEVVKIFLKGLEEVGINLDLCFVFEIVSNFSDRVTSENLTLYDLTSFFDQILQ